MWSATLVNRARAEGRIHDDFAAKTIIDELNKFRGLSGTLLNYGLVGMPLVYTQVVTIAVYTFFVVKSKKTFECTRFITRFIVIFHSSAAFTRQYVNTGDQWEDTLNFEYIPLSFVVEFIIYMGWLKVSESLMNPFGEDDHNFGLNNMIDRNIKLSYLIVDDMHNEHPELLKDQYWNEIPKNLPDKSKERKSSRLSRNNDILDVRVRDSKTQDLKAPVDVEAATSIERLFTPRASSHTIVVNPEQIPRADIIADNYLGVAEVVEKQSLVEREMQLARKKKRQSGYEVDISSSDESE